MSIGYPATLLEMNNLELQKLTLLEKLSEHLTQFRAALPEADKDTLNQLTGKQQNCMDSIDTIDIRCRELVHLYPSLKAAYSTNAADISIADELLQLRETIKKQTELIKLLKDGNALAVSEAKSLMETFKGKIRQLRQQRNINTNYNTNGSDTVGSMLDYK